VSATALRIVPIRLTCTTLLPSTLIASEEP
jgi:hypothetical protein